VPGVKSIQKPIHENFPGWKIFNRRWRSLSRIFIYHSPDIISAGEKEHPHRQYLPRVQRFSPGRPGTEEAIRAGY
jgi:hypothetical protein